MAKWAQELGIPRVEVYFHKKTFCWVYLRINPKKRDLRLKSFEQFTKIRSNTLRKIIYTRSWYYVKKSKVRSSGYRIQLTIKRSWVRISSNTEMKKKENTDGQIGKNGKNCLINFMFYSGFRILCYIILSKDYIKMFNRHEPYLYRDIFLTWLV